MHWYKRDPDAALVGMAPLSLEEAGAYNIILDLIYSRDGILPDDDLLICRTLRCNPRTWRKIKASLIRFGKVWTVDGNLMAKRVEKTLKEARKESELQSNRASKRWELSKLDNENNEGAMPGGIASTTKTKTKTIKKEKIDSVNGHEAHFIKVWAIYPRKQKQGPARVEFYKAIKIVSVEKMIEAIERARPGWASNDPKYTPQLVNWLKDRRWLDELPPRPPEPKFLIPR
jgi:uncharacterized protein YdaU (DUF1376 family)